jgi:hypothetical protein
MIFADGHKLRVLGKAGAREERSAMFKGRAELVDPESGGVVATFTETCNGHDHAAATVRLRTPMTLEGTERLEIFGTQTDQPMISVGASDPAGTEIREFHGTSAIGCIPDDTDVSLVKTPGGPLGTLLIVLGKGKIHRSHQEV